MKTVIESPIGGDGAVAGVYIDAGMLSAKISLPVAKLAEPIVVELEVLRAKLEDVIPGDWENPLVDAAFGAIEDQVKKIFADV